MNSRLKAAIILTLFFWLITFAAVAKLMRAASVEQVCMNTLAGVEQRHWGIPDAGVRILKHG